MDVIAIFDTDIFIWIKKDGDTDSYLVDIVFRSRHC
jgi:hypothetical protein